MYKALEERRKERAKAIEIASRYVERLREGIGPLTAVLHGSFARGDFNQSSDIDVLIISDVFHANPIKRIDLLFASIEGGLSLRAIQGMNS